MDESTEQIIRERAYALWEKEGSPDGRADEFWERARLMVEADAELAPTAPLQNQSAAEQAEDEALKETFPASDPPAFSRPAAGKGS